MTPTTRPEDAMGRLAAIDVGTNSVRLIVVEVGDDRAYRILDDEKVVARLGRGLATSDSLGADVMAETATTISRLREIAQGYGVDEVRAAATWAVREASNGRDFVELVAERAGLRLDVLSAEEEARLAFLGVRHAFDLTAMSVAVMDVGGGSTEFVLGTGELIDRIYALPLGAMSLTERFGTAQSTTDGSFDELRRHVRRTLRKRVGKPPFVPHLLVGTGGTFNTLAAISMHQCSRNRDEVLPFTVRGYEMQRSEVKHILHQLHKMPLRDRTRVAGLSPDRADIIVAGLAIVEAALKHFKINRVRVADQGIRAGLLRLMIDQRWPLPTSVATITVDRMRSVRHFAAACRYEDRHAEHVADLSAQMYDQLAGNGTNGAWGSPQERELLVAAALLHDVGYLVNYSRHHKHSYHLIRHSELAGFTHRELELVANIARYHRGAMPKARHANFARLTAPERDLVRRLAGVLRIAVGLDRSHTQEVRRVRVRCTDRTAFIDVEASGHPRVDLWAGERKAGLFEQTCGRRVQFNWAQVDDRSP